MRDFLRTNGGKFLVGILLVVNGALIAGLVIRQRDLPTASTAIPGGGTSGTQQPGSATTTSSPDPSSATGSSEGQNSAEPGQPSGRRVLAANSDKVAWRAEWTDCDTPSTVQVTTDGGKSWTSTDRGIRSIVRLKAFGPDAVFAIGSDSQCNPTYAWIESPDQQWQHDSTQTSDKWYRVPGDAKRIHDAQGRISRPCADGVSDLAGLGTYRAAVLCNDGRIRTRDEDRGWQTVVRESGAVALNSDDSRWVAAIRTPRCAGYSIRPFDVDGNGLTGAGSCQKAPTPAAGAVAVSNIYATVWLWSGNKVSVSPMAGH